VTARRSLLMRNFRTTVLTSRDRVVFAGAGGDNVVLGTGSPARWSSTLQALAWPIEEAALRARPDVAQDLQPELFDRLVAAGHLLRADAEPPLVRERDRLFVSAPALHLAAGPPACAHLLFGCCGSVVAGLMAQTLLSLCFCGFQQRLDVILTGTAARFLSRELLEAYGIRCWIDAFERQDGIRVPHVNLARSAELIVVCPATAACLARLANSACTDLLSLCITASTAPVLVVPAMNAAMWNDAGVQRNVAALRASGRTILEPALIFGAAGFGGQAQPMYGGHGTLWSGPLGLMQASRAVLELHDRPPSERGG